MEEYLDCLSKAHHSVNETSIRDEFIKDFSGAVGGIHLRAMAVINGEMIRECIFEYISSMKSIPNEVVSSVKELLDIAGKGPVSSLLPRLPVVSSEGFELICQLLSYIAVDRPLAQAMFDHPLCHDSCRVLIIKSFGGSSDDAEWIREKCFKLLPRMALLTHFHSLMESVLATATSPTELEAVWEYLGKHCRLSQLQIPRSSNASESKRRKQQASTAVITARTMARLVLPKARWDSLKKAIINSPRQGSVCDILWFFLLITLNHGPSTASIIKIINDCYCPSLMTAIKFILDSSFKDLMPLLREMTGEGEASRLLYTVILQHAASSHSISMESRQCISTLINQVTFRESSDWAMGLLYSLCCGLPTSSLGMMSGGLKVLLDYLDRLSPASLTLYYAAMAKVGMTLWQEEGDMSVWSDLLMVSRKQNSSLDSQVRLYGIHAILGIIHALNDRDAGNHDDFTVGMQDGEQFMMDAVDAGEASCSQAMPKDRSSKSFSGDEHQKQIIDSLVGLIDLATFKDNINIEAVNHLCTLILGELPKCDPTLLSRLNKRFAKVLQGNFIRELPSTSTLFSTKASKLAEENDGDASEERYSLDGDDAIVEVLLDTPSSPIVPAIFSVVASCEKLLNDGNLDNVDALLGCPIVIGDEDHLLTCWLRVIVNAFADQASANMEIRGKCLQRLQLCAKHTNQPTSGVGDIKDMVECAASLLRGLTLTPLKTNTTLISNQKTFVKIVPFTTTVYEQFISDVPEFLLKELLRDPRAITEAILLKSIDFIESDTNLLPLVLSAWRESPLSQDPINQNLCSTWKAITQYAMKHADVAEAEDVLCLIGVSHKLSMTVEGLAELALSFAKGSSANNTQCGDITLALLKWQPSLKGDLLSDTDDGDEDENGDKDVIDQPKIVALSHGKRIAIYMALMKYLALPETAFIKDNAIYFEKLVQWCRGHIDTSLTIAILREGRLFLERFAKDHLPLLSFSNANRGETMETLKILQQSTRSLHVICSHLKESQASKRASSGGPLGQAVKLVAPMKRTLERLVFRVKEQLERHGCLNAFWIGNLKHRTLDGTEITTPLIALPFSDAESENIGTDDSSSSDKDEIQARDVVTKESTKKPSKVMQNRKVVKSKVCTQIGGSSESPRILSKDIISDSDTDNASDNDNDE